MGCPYVGCLLVGCLDFNFLGFYGLYNIGAKSLFWEGQKTAKLWLQLIVAFSKCRVRV